MAGNSVGNLSRNGRKMLPERCDARWESDREPMMERPGKERGSGLERREFQGENARAGMGQERALECEESSEGKGMERQFQSAERLAEGPISPLPLPQGGGGGGRGCAAAGGGNKCILKNSLDALRELGREMRDFAQRRWMSKESPVVMRFASRLTRIVEDLTAPGGAR